MTLPQSDGTPSNTPEKEESIGGYEQPEPGGWEGYPIDELAIRDERRSAIDVLRRIVNKRILLDPDFQRGFVWDERKQSRLIESVLLRIPLPVFYLAEDNQGRLIAVDGVQRLTTLQRFLQGGLKLKLPDRPELDGKVFSELDPRLQNRVEDCQLLFYIIDHAVPERARLDIFDRVNSGEPLTRQQMRNAIYNSSATEFLREEAETDLFREATGGSLNTKKMQDREFVNRFVAFSLMPLEAYKGDMDKWLADGLLRLKELSGEERERVRGRLRLTLVNNFKVFGKHAFRRHRSPDQDRSVLNASLFDVMAQGLADRSEDEVARSADHLRETLYKLFEDQAFNKAITYGPNSPREVRTRFAMVAAMLQEVFNAD